MNTEFIHQYLPNGPVAAAMIAGGIGSATTGLMTVLAEGSNAISRALAWWPPAGPLTGKALTGVVAFFVAWTVLHAVFRGRNVDFVRVTAITVILLSLGVLGTFPPVFGLFAQE